MHRIARLPSSALFRGTRQLSKTQDSCRTLSTGGNFVLPKPFNEKNYDYTRSSLERRNVVEALNALRAKLPMQVPAIGGPVGSSHKLDGQLISMPMPSEHATVFAQYSSASKVDVSKAIERALAAKSDWQDMPFTDRAAIFLRAADLVSNKYRNELIAATMLGQGKNVWQAEIDAAAELADFFRYNVGFAQEIYDKQPTVNSPGHYGRTDWRPLEGFVYAVSPFNFTAIDGNLVSAPALMGNVVLWKPAQYVIQLVNGDAQMITETALDHKEFSALNFIGSTDVFKSISADIAERMAKHQYRDFPRTVGETSGKNFHLIHSSADIDNSVRHTIRATFEYAGQKCSACSRIYIPESRATAFFDSMKRELTAVKVGPPEIFENFLGPVINQAAFDKITKAMDAANKDDTLETIVGGTYDSSVGFYIDPTIYLSKVPDHPLFNQELFGPVLSAYVYPDVEFDQVLDMVDRQGGGFALTGSVFANDPIAIRKAENKLRWAAGNFYINCKTTGAVIGQQSFGGSRGSGTCDKAGSANLLMRFTAPRTLKEEFNKLDDVLYPSNL